MDRYAHFVEPAVLALCVENLHASQLVQATEIFVDNRYVQ